MISSAILSDRSLLITDTGQFKDGERSGFGKMVYSDDPNSDRLESSITSYEGQWANGKHEASTQAAIVQVVVGCD